MPVSVYILNYKCSKFIIWTHSKIFCWLKISGLWAFWKNALNRRSDERQTGSLNQWGNWSFGMRLLIQKPWNVSDHLNLPVCKVNRVEKCSGCSTAKQFNKTCGKTWLCLNVKKVLFVVCFLFLKKFPYKRLDNRTVGETVNK